jgi:hypothetical protein
MDPEHCTDDGWRGDCPYFLAGFNANNGTTTCSYGCWEEPSCMTDCPGIQPDGWGPSPGGAPCWECGGVGVVPMIRDTSPRYQGRSFL